MARQRNDHLRKVCKCPRTKRMRCRHPWHLNFTYQGTVYRFSLDRLLGRPVDGRTAAEHERDQIIAAIRAGTFQAAPDAVTDDGPVLQTLTLGQLFDRYRESHVLRERPASAPKWTQHADLIARQVVTRPDGTDRAFGDWIVSDITTEAVKGYQNGRRAAGVFAMNRDLGVLRAVFNWGIREGLCQHTPFKRHGVTLIQRGRERARDRRLEPGEGARLLAACGPDLRALVEAALESGCRCGELLSLQWRQVRLDGPRPALLLPAAKTKTGRPREIPISVRLHAVLTMRRTDPTGHPYPAEAYVFGNAVGEPIVSFKRAWATAKLRAHDVTPV